jgi:hypothetical protein
MTTKLEVLRAFGQWVKVDNLGPEQYEIKSHISKARKRYIIRQDEGGTGQFLPQYLLLKIL